MIEARIVKHFPAGEESAGFALDIAFKAGPGITAIFGASGAGKTLTLDCIAGFIEPEAGRIMLHDRILFDAEARVNLAPQKRGCGYVFQNYALFPHMTVRENLAFAAHDLPRMQRERRISELLDRFGLAELAGRYPGQISGGQKQRGSIARALIARPEILLLDEPARGLDATLKTDLQSLLEQVRDSISIPILLVTHDVDECFALAENVIILQAGSIVCQGSPSELLRNPGTAAVAELIGDFNIWEAEVLALDPVRHTSCLRLLGADIRAPYFPGCFRGDRILVCARPEELKLAAAPGANRLPAGHPRITPRAQAVRLDFGDRIVVDAPREDWGDLAGKSGGLWIEIPAGVLRRLTRHH